jgi:hypothetical protein
MIGDAALPAARATGVIRPCRKGSRSACRSPPSQSLCGWPWRRRPQGAGKMRPAGGRSDGLENRLRRRPIPRQRRRGRWIAGVCLPPSASVIAARASSARLRESDLLHAGNLLLSEFVCDRCRAVRGADDYLITSFDHFIGCVQHRLPHRETKRLRRGCDGATFVYLLRSVQYQFCNCGVF